MDVRRPLISLSTAAATGAVCFLISDYSYLIAAIFAAIFFVLIYVFQGKSIMAICIVMTLVLYIDAYIYYNFDYQGDIFKVTVIDMSGDRVYGNIQNRKVLLEGNMGKADKYTEYTIEGSYKPKYDYQNGVCGMIYVRRVITHRRTIRYKMMQYSKNIYKKLEEYIGSKYSSLLMACAYGDKDYISVYEKGRLNNLGISHIICVSGFHISIIYMLLLKLSNIYVSTFLTFLYVMFTGASASSLRAFFMMVVLVLSKKVMKVYDPLSSLCFSMLLLIIYKPYYILDIGFVMSYSAVLGIILFYKKIRNCFYKLPQRIGDAISLSLSAQIFIFPIIALIFKNVSLNFIWGNMFIVPIFSLIIILGDSLIILLNIDFLFKIISSIIRICFICLDGGIYLINMISLPMMSANTSIIAVYITLLIATFFYKRGYRSLKYIFIPLSVYMLFSMYTIRPSISFLQRGYNRCVYVKVGFSKVLITKNSSYDDFKDIDYNFIKSADDSGYIKIDKYILHYDKNLSDMYIQNGKRFMSLKWDNKEGNKHRDYGIIDVKQNGIIYIDKILDK